MRFRLRILSFLLVASVWLPQPTAAQSKAALELVDSFIRLEAERESGRNQTETRTSAASTTSIVERSSVADFIGFGLALAGLDTTGDSESADSYRLTTTAAALWGLATERGPQNDGLYGDRWYRHLRNVNFSLSHDDPAEGDARKVWQFGVQYRFLSEGRTWLGQFAPAMLLDQPATFVFRPEETALYKYANDNQQTVGFYESMRDGLRDVFSEPTEEAAGVVALGNRSLAASWTQDICGASPEKRQAIWAESLGVPESGERLAQAMEFAETYTSWLLCEKTAAGKRFVRSVKTGAGATNESGFHALVDTRTDDMKDRAKEAHHAQIRSIPDSDLTLFGKAVKLWSLRNDPGASFDQQHEDRDAAFQYLRDYVQTRIDEISGDDAAPDDPTHDEVKEWAGGLVDEINKRTELTLDFNWKAPEGGSDSLTGKLVLEASPFKDCSWLFKDCNYLRYLNLTANAGVDYEEKEDDGDHVGGSAAIEMQMPFDVPSMFGLREYEPMLGAYRPTLSFAGMAKWIQDDADTYVGQAKLEIPVRRLGIKIPLSVTLSNRKNLVEERETEVRGLVGFTVDTTQLANAGRKTLAGLLD